MIARHKFAYPLDQVAGNIYIIYISLFKKKKCNILVLRTTYPDVSTDDWLLLSFSLSPIPPNQITPYAKKEKKEKNKGIYSRF